MIDERHEELASLYALDLLEGGELAQFERALAEDPELKSLVRELRDASATLAHTAPAAQPPAALKQRVLWSIAERPMAAQAPENIIRPAAFRLSTSIPWGLAACLALGLAWLGQRHLSLQSEAVTLRNQQALTAISLQSAQQQVEAERILAQRQLEDSAQQLITNNTQLGNARSQLSDARTQMSDARTQLADRDRLIAEVRSQVADRDRQLAQTRSQLSDRDRQIAALAQRVEALDGTSADRGRQLAEAKQMIAMLTDELKTQGNLANLKIATLASMLKNSPQARAVAVWDPKKQEGVFAFEKLPPITTDQKLELWVVEAKEGAKPVSAGVLKVSADASARIQFRPTTAVSAVKAFAISREKNDGAASHAAPAEVIMLGSSR